MKGLMVRISILAMISIGFAPVAVAQIFKTVDEDGNVVYTDKAPDPEAEPMTLRELSVVETPEYPSRDAKEAEEDGKEVPLSQLRREYRDFRLVSPTQDQNFWGTGNTATLAWDAGKTLATGMQVVFYLNGEAMAPTRASTYNTGQLDRGEHNAKAELRDSSDRIVASSGDVTFFVKQQSRLINNNARPTPTPQGGG